jgi:SlyX protein
LTPLARSVYRFVLTMSHEERVKELEIKVMYQERLVETLNQVMVGQRAEIDALNKRLEALEEQLHGALEDAPDPPPPHY